MNKSDLKTGMLTQTRDGQWWFVFRDIEDEYRKDFIYCMLDNEYGRHEKSILLNIFDENLKYSINNEKSIYTYNYDIITIAKCKNPPDFFTEETTNEHVEFLYGFKIIWARKDDTKKITKEEALKELEKIHNCKIEIV